MLGGSGLLLFNGGYGRDTFSENDGTDFVKEVSLADSLGFYTNLLEEIRRLVLRSDAEKIFTSKMLATDWLGMIIWAARALLLKYPQSTAIVTNDHKEEVYSFISRVTRGEYVREDLIQMREHPLEEIKRLDRNFDSIRSSLVEAGNLIKTARQPNSSSGEKSKNLQAAKERVSFAMKELKKYDSPEIEKLRQALESEYQTRLTTPSRLNALLQTVYDSVGDTQLLVAGDAEHPSTYFARASYQPTTREPVLPNGIISILTTRLNPASWLQIGIGYGVSFPILMRVSDKEQRIKLLNDALRLVPPGLRDPILSDLANDLANL